MFFFAVWFAWMSPGAAHDVVRLPPTRVVRESTISEVASDFELEQLYDQARFEDGLRQAEAALAEDPENPVYYRHVARFMYELAEGLERTTSKVDKKAYYKEMIALIERGLEKSPEDPHLLFYLGVAKGRLGTTRGVLASLFLADEVEAHWKAAASSSYVYNSLGGQETLPCDAHLTLGIFYRLVPDWWIVKVLSGTRGDLDRSLAHLEYADTCAPDRPRIVKELGATQLCIGTKRRDEMSLEAGRATLLRLRTLSSSAPTDDLDKRFGEEMLRDPTSACGHSRDGHQEQDRAKLEEGTKG